MKDDTKEFFTCTLIRLIDGESVAREPDPLISMNMADAVREVLREYTNVQPGYELPESVTSNFLANISV